jgi:hypothetical protein
MLNYPDTPLAGRVLVVPGTSLGVAAARHEPFRDSRRTFLDDCRVDAYRHEKLESVRITHLPSGREATGETKERAADTLARLLLENGLITPDQAGAHQNPFGPFAPILPVPAGETGPTGRPPPRRWQYPAGGVAG